MGPSPCPHVSHDFLPHSLPVSHLDKQCDSLTTSGPFLSLPFHPSHCLGEIPKHHSASLVSLPLVQNLQCFADKPQGLGICCPLYLECFSSSFTRGTPTDTSKLSWDVTTSRKLSLTTSPTLLSYMPLPSLPLALCEYLCQSKEILNSNCLIYPLSLTRLRTCCK